MPWSHQHHYLMMKKQSPRHVGAIHGPRTPKAPVALGEVGRANLSEDLASTPAQLCALEGAPATLGPVFSAVQRLLGPPDLRVRSSGRRPKLGTPVPFPMPSSEFLTDPHECFCASVFLQDLVVSASRPCT